MLVRKRHLSRVTPFFFRSSYGSKFAKLNKVKVDAEESIDSISSASSTSKKKNKKKIKKKSVKKSRAGFVFLFNKNIYLPTIYRKKRISIYTGKTFFSFVVKLKYVYTRIAEFVSTKKFGSSIHKKVLKNKATGKKKSKK